MAGSVQVDELINCDGIGGEDAMERVLFLASPSYKPVTVGANRVKFVRSYRPLWALALGVLLTPVFIGIALFFVKTTEMWTATVESDHRRVLIRLNGRVNAALRNEIIEALNVGAEPVGHEGTRKWAPPSTRSIGSAPIPASRPSAAPIVQPEPSKLERTPLASSRNEAEPLASDDFVIRRAKPTPAARPESLYLMFDTGQRHRVSKMVLIGRDPARGPEDLDAEVLVVHDQDLSLSKTHASIEPIASGIRICDRGSTNGLRIEVPTGEVIEVGSGEVVEVAVGAIVRLGYRTFVLAGETD